MADEIRVAVVGCGVMGSVIATRLMETGCTVSAFDLDTAKVSALAGTGARAASSASDAASASDYVITSLNSAAIVRTAVFGDEGVAEGARDGLILIDMSSIDPRATAAMAQEAAGRGISWLDAPLSGGAPKAAVGALTVMAGGKAETFEAAKTVMDKLCANFTHMGPSGAGQTTKLINQVLCGIGFMAVAEATQLALDAGVDAAKIPVALKGGRADSALLQEYMPRFADKDYRRTGRIDNMVKDLNAAQDLARHTHTAMPLTALSAEVHRMLTAAGLGGEDQAALMEFFKGPDREQFK
ncbi:MAG: NAD(P)-dependent oxidoreductase [Pseudomonadota bacterium]